MIIEKGEYTLDVDVEKTADYYKTNTLCMCPDCRNFHIQATDEYPLLTHFLSEFGVNISRPDELSAHEFDNKIDYHFVAYTVVGKILQSGKYEIDITDNGHFLNIIIDNSYVPNEQTDDYFTVTVFNVQLPWVLDEPYPGKSGRVSLLLKKIKSLLKKENSRDLFSNKRLKEHFLPSREVIVKRLYDKYLDAFSDEVVKVVYSKDETMRYVVLKSEKGFYTYQLEAIYQLDEGEWKYLYSGDASLPALWEPYRGSIGKSLYETEEELLREMQNEPEYKQYF